MSTDNNCTSPTPKNDPRGRDKTRREVAATGRQTEALVAVAAVHRMQEEETAAHPVIPSISRDHVERPMPNGGTWVMGVRGVISITVSLELLRRGYDADYS